MSLFNANRENPRSRNGRDIDERIGRFSRLEMATIHFRKPDGLYGAVTLAFSLRLSLPPAVQSIQSSRRI